MEGGIPNYDKLYDKWIKTAQAGEFAAFTFNNESVKNQVAAMNDIYNTNIKLLSLGFTDEPQKDIKATQKKLKAAGADEVYSEMTRQAKECKSAAHYFMGAVFFNRNRRFSPSCHGYLNSI